MVNSRLAVNPAPRALTQAVCQTPFAASDPLFLGDLASGALTPLAVEPADWLRIAELVAKYADLPLGTVDASVVAAAERLEVEAIATFDRRQFGVVRPSHVDAFRLVP